MPCTYHKKYDVHCSDCHYYDETNSNILIIKLGAIGDVIRTTPLLSKLWVEYPKAKIWWLTYSPEIIPYKVDKILDFSAESILTIQNVNFDIAINLDKDIPACALLNSVTAGKKYGFDLRNGIPHPINELAVDKFITGIFDDVNKGNTKSYLEEIFSICDFKFNGEEYILNNVAEIDWKINNNDKKVIGLNTGCGARWISRLWSDNNWIELTQKLIDSGYYPLLLGGKQEDEKNKFFAEKTGACYLGHFGMAEFTSLMNQCDLIVSAVTMGMHLAIGLKKPLILMNNIFNPYEFELYGRGEIVSPEKECKCFFSPKCKNDDYFCMESLNVNTVFDSIKKNIS